jgi:hypothetical protein
MRLPSALLVTLLVAVAGCAGAPTAGPSDAATVAGVPDELPDDCRLAAVPAADDPPPETLSDAPAGVSADGLSDARAVAVGHYRALRGTTFTFYSDGESGGSSFARCAQVNAETGAFYEVRLGSRRAERVELYSDGETVYRRAVYANGSTSVTQTPAVESGLSALGLTRRTSLHARFTDVNGSLPVAGVGDGPDGGHYRMAPVGNVTTGGGLSVTYTNFTLVVRDDGVVRQLDYARRIEIRNETRVLTARQRYGAVGSTRVERPDWVPSE